MERLRQFLVDVDAPYSENMVPDIIQGLQKLRLFPRLGRPVRRAAEPDAIRDWYIGWYCVRYLIEENVIHTKNMARQGG